MEEKQSLHHRQHMNLSDTSKQMLEELTARRYPGKQRRQSQVVEDLIVEAWSRERDTNAYRAVQFGSTFERVQPVATIEKGISARRVAEQHMDYAPATPSGSTCSSCQREVRPDWFYCVYCGASLSTCCHRCGAPREEGQGVRFCYACGEELERETMA